MCQRLKKDFFWNHHQRFLVLKPMRGAREYSRSRYFLVHTKCIIFVFCSQNSILTLFKREHVVLAHASTFHFFFNFEIFEIFFCPHQVFKNFSLFVLQSNFQGIARHCKEWQGIARNCKSLQEISSHHKTLQAIVRQSKVFQEITKYFKEMQDILSNCYIRIARYCQLLESIARNCK